MKYEITITEIQQTSTTPEPNKWGCTMIAIGNNEEINKLVNHCRNYPPTNKCNCKKCGGLDIEKDYKD